MRIRKRSTGPPSVAAAVQPLPTISCKYQQHQVVRRAPGPQVKAECSNMQPEVEAVRGDVEHESPQQSSSSAGDAEDHTPVAMKGPRDDDDDVEEGDLSGSLEEVSAKGRRRKPSPTKRRKIEHDSSLLFEGTSSMTAAELLAVNELANGVRQRLAASEQSTSETATKSTPPPAKPSSALENSKDALISSIFYIFDTCGDNGLSASEVVKAMLEQRLPGLKEGGARHTVQVANVLRSSSSFISLGDKKYLLCSTLDESSSKKPSRGAKAPVSPPSDSSDEETLNPKPRRKPAARVKRAETPKPEKQSSEGEPVVRIARRRGPSSSQKGKGPTQCKRYDGRGWQCSRLTEPGYSLCVHHQDLINKRAAKLKEQQTLSRLQESVNRKTKPAPPPPPPPPPSPPAPASDDADPPSDPETPPEPEPESNPASLKLKILLSRDHRDQKDKDQSNSAPVQKRKMLSLLAIK